MSHPVRQLPGTADARNRNFHSGRADRTRKLCETVNNDTSIITRDRLFAEKRRQRPIEGANASVAVAGNGQFPSCDVIRIGGHCHEQPNA